MTNEERLQKIVQAQGEQIACYGKLVRNYEELTKTQDERIKELKRNYSQAQWIAIFEFLTLFTESKGEIVNSRYVQSAFELIGIPLTEENILGMAEYAQKHFKRDEEYTKQMQASK